MTKATKRRTTLLTDDELYDLHMALDVLCGCYSTWASSAAKRAAPIAAPS